MADVTGYKIGALRQGLYELAQYIRNSLKPDRLAGFDLESVLVTSDLSLSSDELSAE